MKTDEAGYEPLQGLSTSRQSSAHYSERTYLRARAFIVTPVSRLRRIETTVGIEGFEDIMFWLYLSTAGPQLTKRAIEAGQRILKNSEDSQIQRDGLNAVSRGAALLLQRAVQTLDEVIGGSTTF